MLTQLEVRNRIIQNKKIIDENSFWGKPKSDAFTSLTSHLPPITRANREEYNTKTAFSPPRNETYVREFEKLSLKTRERSKNYHQLDKEKKEEHLNDSSVLQAKDINEAVRTVVSDIAFGHAAPVGPSLKRLPFALKIIGATINGDLDFSNLNLDFSVRLIGCHIVGAILLDRTHIKTLDISGCVIERGMSASGAELSGAFRGRRTVSHSAVDLAGLQCEGMFDLTDAILVPRCEPSDETSHVAHRGILNLAYADLKKGLRLERARIYGAINFRKLTTGGILLLNDAVLRCATAHVEMIAAAIYLDVSGEKKETAKGLLPPTRITLMAASEVAEYLHDTAFTGRSQADYKKSVECETLFGLHPYKSFLKNGFSLQIRLIAEHGRGADTALMLESAEIGGPVFAKGARICGRVRMKRLNAQGGVFLEGARIRSPRSIKTGNRKIYSELEARRTRSKAQAQADVSGMSDLELMLEIYDNIRLNNSLLPITDVNSPEPV